MAIPLHLSHSMQLDEMLDRCESLETRASALYRRYAASARSAPRLCALWTELAREEEEHAKSIALARSRIEAPEGWRTLLAGCRDALAEVERRLAAAEALGTDTTTTSQLSMALDLEMSELEGLRRLVLAACRQPDASPDTHAVKLAEAAAKLSDDPHVRMQAALLRARARLHP